MNYAFSCLRKKINPLICMQQLFRICILPELRACGDNLTVVGVPETGSGAPGVAQSEFILRAFIKPSVILRDGLSLLDYSRQKITDTRHYARTEYGVRLVNCRPSRTNTILIRLFRVF